MFPEVIAATLRLGVPDAIFEGEVLAYSPASEEFLPFQQTTRRRRKHGVEALAAALLKQFKGIGDVGADIFLREVQAVWDEVRPFVDRRARAGAKTLGLPDDPQALLRLVDDRDFPRLVAALLRAKLAGDADVVLAQAQQARA
jgi:hypothetical protein